MRPMSVGLYELMVMSATGRVVARRSLTLEDTELYYKTYGLSEEGILVALLCFEEEIQIVWWRSDDLIVDGGQSG